MTMISRLFALGLLCSGAILLPLTASAQSPYAPGWDLDPESSYIRFRSVKNEDGQEVVETHSFTVFEGQIDENGAAEIKVQLESVDTNNDLRNVRMRFLFFETFKFPEAKVDIQLTPAMAAGVAETGRKELSVPISFNIHGVTRELNADITVEAEGDNRFVVSSGRSLLFDIADFGLQNNLTKLAQTAGGFRIEPFTNITFSLAFNKRPDETPTQTATVIVQEPEPQPQAEPEQPQSFANETTGNFTVEQCVGRFEILSETGNIYFASGSARLDSESVFVLSEITDIIERCPGLRILITGHTDDVGSSSYNLRLSEERAASVQRYLVNRGIERRRLFTTGYGEDAPMVPNTTDFNRSRNRRIEFSLL